MSADFPTSIVSLVDPALTENLGDMCGGLGHVDALKNRMKFDFNVRAVSYLAGGKFTEL